MESTSLAMKVHISEETKNLIGSEYKVTERAEIEVKGKGSMKTYWLEECENRDPLEVHDLVEEAQDQALHIDYNSDRRMSMPPTPLSKSDATAEDRRVYSPITFEDVAKRSIVNSPVRSIFSARSRTSRSNSMGHAFLSCQSPSEVFGSLINDTEEFLEDLHQRNSSAGTSVFSPNHSPMFSPVTSARPKREKKKIKAVDAPGQVKLLCHFESDTLTIDFYFVFQFTPTELALLKSKQKPAPPADNITKNSTSKNYSE